MDFCVFYCINFIPFGISMNDNDQPVLEFYDISHRHRTGDPETSKEAAAEITTSGTAARQAEQVLELVRRQPKSTSKELAFVAGCNASTRNLDYHAIARRLPELERAGLIRRGPARKCTRLILSGNRRKATTWEPIR